MSVLIAVGCKPKLAAGCMLHVESVRHFELLAVKDAHARRHCRDWNGTEPWACCECDCTRRLETKLQSSGKPFIESLERRRDLHPD